MRPAHVILLWVPVGTALWTFAPLDRRAPAIQRVPVVQTTDTVLAEAVAPLDVDAFRAPLWVAPPAPPPPAPPPLPPPPVRLQLLAIVRERNAYRAVFYDPDADRVFAAGDGDTAAGRRVERVTAVDVQLRDGGAVRTLALREGSAR